MVPDSEDRAAGAGLLLFVIQIAKSQSKDIVAVCVKLKHWFVNVIHKDCVGYALPCLELYSHTYLPQMDTPDDQITTLQCRSEQKTQNKQIQDRKSTVDGLARFWPVI